MNDLSIFSGKYSVSKTLRFELIPVGDTLSHIQEKGIISADTALAESYMGMKKTIDCYHKSFIDRSLSGITLIGLEAYYALYTASAEAKKDKSFDASFSAAKASLRKEIVKAFKAQADFNSLGKEDLIKKNLAERIALTEVEQGYVEQFRNFTTYFTGYNQNRMNMYSDEEKATAVAYRLINENLPKFIDNIHIFEKIAASPVAGSFTQLCIDMEPWLNVTDLAELFTLKSFSSTLTQPQIDAYNTVIGGRREDDIKLKGLNEYINLYNQTHPDAKLPKLKMLYKQILSDRISASWLPEVFETGAELLEAVNAFYRSEFQTDDAECAARVISSVLSGLPQAEFGKIYVSSDALTGISQKLFGFYGLLKDALGIDPEKENKNACYSLAELQTALDNYAAKTDKDANPAFFEAYSHNCIAAYFSTGMTELLTAVQSTYREAEELLNTSHEDSYQLSKDDTASIKKLLDAMMDVLHFVKPLYLSADTLLVRDDVFYGVFSPAYERLKELTKLYDKVRNFATKKPYSTEKIKLNFDNPQLLGGWVANKERDYSSILLREGEYYYLGIMDKASKSEFKESIYLPPASPDDIMEKMLYLQASDPAKDVQNFMVIDGKTVKKNGRKDSDGENRILENLKCQYLPPEINKIRKERTYSKASTAFSKSDLTAFVDYYKARAIEYYKDYQFIFKESSEYRDFSEFTDDINSQAYQVRFVPTSRANIYNLVRDGKLYLFKIHNKDFSPNSKGKPNLHTMYWKALFAEDNLRDVVYKLNGEAEVFYRKASIADKDRIIHSAGQPINKKNPKLKGQSSLFDYDLIKDRRYTVDKFQFHVPITMNFKASGTVRLNDDVCAYLKNNPDVNIIGIDRGERHLLYISMIDRNGKVVKDSKGKYIQYSLNTITGKYTDSSGAEVAFETPYHELLDRKETERDEARKSWGTIENIKELKNGYMSQVVHHIAKLMVEYNAIVVLEDLNGGFKNGRKKVEKQVYQNFEKALIEKLNYLVFKDVPADEPGGLYNALQLTNKFESFGKLTRQSGFLFYIPAWNTSKIDPVTGFVDILKPKTGMSVKEAIQFFSRFDRIEYNADKDWFEFEFDYSNFTTKAEGTRTHWTVCTHGGLRYAFNRSLNNNRGGYETWNVTERLKKHFNKYGIDYRSGDLREAIAGQKSAGFFASLVKLLQVTLAMRYSSAEDGRDFILSPVADKNGEFYCSEGRCDGLPQDADANGAFNIARKGLCVLEQIDKAEKYGDWTTKISNKDWLSFVQSKAE